MSRLVLLLTSILLGAGCGGGVALGAGDLPPAPPGQGFVRIRCAPADADVYVDGRYRGRLDGYPEGVLSLPSGDHRLSLRKRGSYAWYGQLTVSEARPAEVETHLVPEIPDPTDRPPPIRDPGADAP